MYRDTNRINEILIKTIIVGVVTMVLVFGLFLLHVSLEIIKENNIKIPTSNLMFLISGVIITILAIFGLYIAIHRLFKVIFE